MNKQPVIFITGGSRGIGKAIVEHFADRGWLVAACATAEANLVQSKAHLTFACDVRDVNQVKAGIKQVVKMYGQIDVLVNNAGIAGTNPLTFDSSDDMWHDIINTNLHGSYYMCKYALPYFPDKKGRIINIASVLGLKGVPDQIAYCAAKHAVIGLTRSLALYVASRGITVNAICPGWVDTDMAEGRFDALNLTRTDVEQTIPLGNLVTSAEIAALIFYLTSPAAGKITGQAITIDGGAIL